VWEDRGKLRMQDLPKADIRKGKYGKPASRNMQARESAATENALKKQGKRTESREDLIPAVCQY